MYIHERNPLKKPLKASPDADNGIKNI